MSRGTVNQLSRDAKPQFRNRRHCAKLMPMKRLLTILCLPALLLLGGPSEGYAFDETDLKQLRAMNHCAKCVKQVVFLTYKMCMRL